jgi:hypothetical protein
MTTLTAATALAPTCEARVGFYPGEFAEVPLWCSARIGLTTWTDSSGQTHRACRHHVDGLQHRYPVAVEPCFFCHRTDMVAVGCYSRVTLGTGVVNLCDNCREKGDESSDDEPDFDRESQPEFNGAFR